MLKINTILQNEEIYNISNQIVAEFLKNNASSILEIKKSMKLFTNLNYKKAYVYNILLDLYLKDLKINLEDKEIKIYFSQYPNTDCFNCECFQDEFDYRFNTYYKHMISQDVIISKLMDKCIWNDYYTAELI